MGRAICSRDSLLKWSIRLSNPNGDMLMMPINGKFLKKYYPWSS